MVSNLFIEQQKWKICEKYKKENMQKLTKFQFPNYSKLAEKITWEGQKGQKRNTT